MLSKKRTWLEEVVPFESSQVPKIATFLCDSPLDRNGCFTCYINCYSSTEMMNDISIDKVLIPNPCHLQGFPWKELLSSQLASDRISEVNGVVAACFGKSQVVCTCNIFTSVTIGMLLNLFFTNSSPMHPDIFRCFRKNRRGFPPKSSTFIGVFHYYNPSILGCFPNSICNSYHLQDLVFQPDALRPLIPALKKRQCKCLAVTVAVSGGRKKGGKVNQSRRFQFDDLDGFEMNTWNACLGNEHQK